MSALDSLLAAVARTADDPEGYPGCPSGDGLTVGDLREIAKLIKDQSDALELYENPDSLISNEAQERIAFIREAALVVAGAHDADGSGWSPEVCWSDAQALWAAKPEDC